ncbi:hypothetical protein F5Y19DRAFT_53015 [Xylariaceae sp. FL1651]|nr:hypothetical protein F5Y19DRAFT_53015 [Xylariaceae sp. FL1651]
MLLFDDKNDNKEVELWQSSFLYSQTPCSHHIKPDMCIGVTLQKVQDARIGITWTDYERGIEQWRRYNALRIEMPISGIHSLQPYFVGWVGTDVPNANQ